MFGSKANLRSVMLQAAKSHVYKITESSFLSLARLLTVTHYATSFHNRDVARGVSSSTPGTAEDGVHGFHRRPDNE